MKISAALFGIILSCGSAATAQPASSEVEKPAKKLEAALDGLNKALSNGSAEAVSGAGEGLFSAAGDIVKASGEDSTIGKPHRPKKADANPEPKSAPKPATASDQKLTCHQECYEYCTDDHVCHWVCHVTCE